MKMTLVALILVVALSTKALLGEAGAAPEQIVDTSGKKVRAGENYYIVPASADVGGLALSTTGQDCPLDVVAVDGYQGLQLSFLPVVQATFPPRAGLVHLSPFPRIATLFLHYGCKVTFITPKPILSLSESLGTIVVNAMLS